MSRQKGGVRLKTGGDFNPSGVNIGTMLQLVSSIHFGFNKFQIIMD